MLSAERAGHATLGEREASGRHRTNLASFAASLLLHRRKKTGRACWGYICFPLRAEGQQQQARRTSAARVKAPCRRYRRREPVTTGGMPAEADMKRHISAVLALLQLRPGDVSGPSWGDGETEETEETEMWVDCCGSGFVAPS